MDIRQLHEHLKSIRSIAYGREIEERVLFIVATADILDSI